MTVRSRLRPLDLLNEALIGVGARPARMISTVVGTAIGIAALVATLGLGQTAAAQVRAEFDAVGASRLQVTSGGNGPGSSGAVMPWSAPESVGRLSGVLSAATFTPVDIGPAAISTVQVIDPAHVPLPVPVVAVSPDALQTWEGRVSTGRMFDHGHDQRTDPVVVLGSGLAQRLGITRVDSRPSLFIGERPFSVIGIVDDLQRRGTLLDAVILPNGTAAKYFGLSGPAELDVLTVAGAAQQVAEQAAVAVNPNDPTSVSVAAPPPPGGLSDRVRGNVDGMFLAFGGVALIVGAFAITAVTLLAVRERRGEIGLRRALGARRRFIGAIFLTESVITGLIGGILGAAAGAITITAVSAVREWTPVLATWPALLAPIAGAAVGVLAGAYPAITAAKMEPIAALRAEG